VIFYGLTTGKEDDDFLFGVSSQEREEEEETLVWFADYVALLEGFHGGMFHVGVDVNVERFRSKRHSCKIFDFCGLCGGEEH
jgi:hypothetical protein